MELKEIAQKLGVEGYPECLEQIYAQIANDTAPACDLDLIEKAQKEYDVFEEYYDQVVEAAKQINEDPVYSAWAKVVAVYLSDKKWGLAKEIPIPKLGQSVKQDLVMLAATIPLIPSAAEKYAKGGFSKEKIGGYLRGYAHCLGSTESRNGVVGLDATYFPWLQLFANAEIFDTYGIQFQFTKLRKGAAYLKDKETGTILPVLTEGLVHASGKQFVGSLGFNDEEGAFTATFTETEVRYIGYGVHDAKISTVLEEFPKSRWECVARPGDKCLGIHLPRNCDITEENLRKACASAREIIDKAYPEYIDVPMQCTSWLLDPSIEEIVGPNSKIVKFGKLFVRYPCKIKKGRSANSFVFPGKPVADADLPEKSSLQRGLKQRYLAGGGTFSHAGILLF